MLTQLQCNFDMIQKPLLILTHTIGDEFIDIYNISVFKISASFYHLQISAQSSEYISDSVVRFIN